MDERRQTMEIAKGSIYALKIEDLGNKIAIENDNGSYVVVNKEDVKKLCEVLNKCCAQD